MATTTGIHPNTPPPVIRPLAASDLPSVKAVIDAIGLFPSAMLDDMVSGYLGNDASEGVWLTCDDGAPVALAYYAPELMTSGTWNLYLLAVRPDRQGQGIGTALIRHVERAVASHGARVLLVETSGLPDFERTRAFYDRIGYEREARIRDFYAAGEDKIVFRKAFESPSTDDQNTPDQVEAQAVIDSR